MQDARAGAEPIGSAAVAMATLSGSGISRKLLRLDNRAGLIRVSAHIETAATAAATHTTATDSKHASSNKTYYAGDRIEARYKGRTRYYPGVIRRANRDGTYDIDYDDGEKELSVDAELIKLVSSNSSSSEPASNETIDRPNSRDTAGLRVGAKISARYRGRDKYYSGIISHVNRDGTYDIDYDDGEKELSVLAEFIKQSNTIERSPTRRISSDTANVSSNSSSKPAQLQLHEGDAITARYRGRERYYSGVIRRVHRDGTYDINYDDGEKELSVPPEFIKSDSKNASSTSNTKTATAILEGDAIEARYRGRQRWYAGVVRRVNRDGTYDINYNDGEREVGIAADFVRLSTNSTNNNDSSNQAAADTRTAVTVQLREGDKIEARYKGRSRYYSGTIKRANRDGTYDINYDDGERELSVDAELIRSAETAARSSPSRGTTRTDSIDDNSNQISRSSAKAVDFIIGDKIEARYKGRERYYSGTVRRANRDGTYDIDYDDGEKELSVAAKLIRLIGSANKSKSTVADSSKKLSIELLEGDAIEARYRGRERWYAGVVRRVNRDGTYDINYDDGERELSVAAALVRTKDDVKGRHDSIDDSNRGTTTARTTAAATAAHKPREGDRVEARYKGRTRYYSGLVRRAHRDGTYDIDYDDGEKESSVDAELVRLLDSNSSSSGTESATATVHKPAVLGLREGDKIEARYKGRERWYAGTINRVNRDGSYDINYDDGERELGVAAELVRLVGTTSAKADVTVQLREGDKIEARNKGRERYFSGTVKRVNRDDTYDINYDDGERELGVEARFVRLLGSNNANSSSSNSKASRAALLQLREGDKMEARYRGRERWFPGVIRRVNRDDTYDISYDDGEKELSVAVDLIRLISNSSNSSSKYATDSATLQLREGDKIEARYKGRERWYAGVIKRANRDDTYDILYDDGEREVGVDARLVRLLTDNNRSSSSNRAAAVELVAGDKVQARYRGRERYYSGTIKRVNRDGTYDINYDDGEKELSVAAEYVKLTAVAASPTRRSTADSDVHSIINKPTVLLIEGDKIEARYKGRDRYYTGVVRRANRDGTYDIDYDDGERERSVNSDLIRLVKQPSTSGAAIDRRQSPERRAVRSDSIDSISSATDRNKLVKGATVEAAYKGRDRYYSGRIARVHRDGSCDVDYDDGEQEIRVSKHLIRLKAEPTAAVANKRSKQRDSGRHVVQQRDSSKRTARTSSKNSDSISDSSIDNGHSRRARGANSSSKQRSTSPHRSTTATAKSSSKQRDHAGSNSDSDDSIELSGTVSEIAAKLVTKYGKRRGLHSEHGKIVETIANGQPAADVARLKKVRTVFEELSDKYSNTVGSGLILAGDVWRVAVAVNAEAHSVKHIKTQFAAQADTDATVNLVTVIAALGFLFNTCLKEQHPIAFNTANTTAKAAVTATSVHAAVALLKLHATTPEVRLACDTVLRLISNVLREPTAQQYWCISTTNDVYNARVASYTGGSLLMNAAGFIKLAAAASSSSEWFVLYSAVDSKLGKLFDKLSDKALTTLRALRDELNSELSLLDSTPSIIEAMRQLRQTCSIRDATIAAEAVLTCIHNVLSKPTDTRVRSIRASNSVYMNQIGRHKAGAQLMAAAGFTLCKGNGSTTDDVFALKDETATSTTAKGITTVAQPLSESTLAALIRRKHALETYIDETREHGTNADIPIHAATMKAPSSTVTFGTATNGKSKQQQQLSKTVPARNIKSALKRTPNTKHSGNSNNSSSSTAGVSSLQMQLLRQSFSALDASQNGKLSSTEVKAALQRMGRDASDKAVANWIQSRDINQDGA
eukprot:2370-Heterococcus_DN1.PRE.4